MDICICEYYVEGMQGNTECLEDLVLYASSIYGRVAMEEEIAVPGHYNVLKGNGGGIHHTVPQVRQWDVDACGGGILEGSDEVAKS